ncbi:hypothetical protein UCRNP2_3132 [Neofusicoccum parvum UCRNP2]|uniref:Ima1 N-terminal domain-containing protein n=1 Tax=Botryosphaeria parva (strain UCR-NP2) TaxID=1287680 RepID=R1ER99_BOTPV|nr:hypothetical protein UCRNP2_3132 [Neofusicoccum parvum UCRNP2]
MPMLLRRNLTCFYCGAKSELKKDSGIRQFDCKECEATNYLDENGEITDPPVAESAQPARFAHYVPARSPSPNLSAPDRNLFCATCLKNQHLLTQTLASYLPPPSDPSYKAFERSYPEYRRNLERRYPPVCADCAPRVRERIQETSYTAKTDHLKRLLNRPRRNVDKRYYTGPTWQSVLVYWAGWFWWVSVAIHLFWSVLGTFAVPGRLGAGRDVYAQNVVSCSKQAWRYGAVQADCVSTFSGEMKFALMAMAATFWWNNKLHAKQLQQLINNSKNEPSPFRGTLPPAPIGPAHKLRNPPNQPTFKKTPLAKQKDFFSKLMGSNAAPTNPNHYETASTADTEWRLNNMSPQQLQKRRIEMEFAEPKLRLQPPHPVDTGLESMFDTVFSIRDEPEEVQRQRAEEREQGKGWIDEAWDAPTPPWVAGALAGAVAMPFALMGVAFAWGWVKSVVVGGEGAA